MSKWLMKAFLQGAMSLTPTSEQLNYVFQRKITKSLTPTPDKLITRLRWAQIHIDHYNEYSENSKDSLTVLELGTGWFPTVPIALFLCGCETIYTIDIKSLLFDKYFREMLSVFAGFSFKQLHEILPSAQRNKFVHLNDVISNSSQMQINQILDLLNIKHIIGDARDTSLGSGTIDFFVSNTTMEHIPHDYLIDIFNEFQRIGHLDSVHSHLIDMDDHYAYFDKSITVYNFLKFSKSQWRWFNNSLHYQNRLRISDYDVVMKEAGYSVLREKINNRNAILLEKVNIHEDYAHYPNEDLTPSSAWFILKPDRA